MSNFVILQDGLCSDRHPSGVIALIGARLIDFSHLTPEQRIELADQLWDSLELTTITPSAKDID